VQFTGQANAAGYAFISVSPSGVSVANANSAEAEDASVIWFNPAGMTNLDITNGGGKQLFLDLIDDTESGAIDLDLPFKQWGQLPAKLEAGVWIEGKQREFFARRLAVGTVTQDEVVQCEHEALLFQAVQGVQYRIVHGDVFQHLEHNVLVREGHHGRVHDELPGQEGVFLACSFWLVNCLARQGRLDDARKVFERAVGTGNDLGLFAEEYHVGRKEMLGNFPQGLTHLSLIMALVALNEAGGRR